jgi:2-polyprenyl-3-methyl-5-hydroxy-6-metoxy-1,4-benzoquinol methylase
MDIQTFLELFIKELEVNRDLQSYYSLLSNKRRFFWRKAYLEQRLSYVYKQLGTAPGRIWDVGCGYGTTAIFLALNGFEVQGNTLEFYYDKIFSRLEYWSRHGNLDNLKVEYANLFDMPDSDAPYDAIIAQDTLHHLEPVKEAADIFNRSLKHNGRFIVAEENGSSILIGLKNFHRRGFKKTTQYYDERLGKSIMMGNENAKSLQAWKRILQGSGLTIVDFEYIRFLPPCFFTGENYQRLIGWEKQTGKKTTLLREGFYFGINFTAIKKA